MSESKFNRTKKKQMGQFMTPISLSKSLIKDRKYNISDKILEPSFGEGSFLIAIIDKRIDLYDNTIRTQEKIDKILEDNLYSVEMDIEIYQSAINNIESRYDCKVNTNNLINDDFFNVNYYVKFNNF